MIRSWLFEFFPAFGVFGDPEQDFDPQQTQGRFSDYLELWRRDEALGFDGIFFSEHHFGQTYSPSPNLLIAHLAALTKTIRLGVLGTVSPYATPWRVVEEFAMLDHLTQGRLEMGLVSGIPPEIAAVGIDPQDAIERHAEIMQVMQGALTQKYLTHHGKHWNFDNLNLQPRMLQKNPAIWTAAVSPASAARAGANGWSLSTGFLPVAQVKALFDSYRAAAKAAGRVVGPDHLALRRNITFVEREEDREQAHKEAQETFKRAIIDRATGPDTPAPPLAPEEFVVGTPQQVADELIRQCRAVGCANLVMGATGSDFESVARCHEKFGQYVVPALRAATVELRATEAVN